MKKTLLASFLMVLGCALSSRAVVIGWAGSNVPSDATSAMLVYVPNVNVPPQYDGTLGNLLNGAETVGTAASGGALVGGYILAQQTEDTATRSVGAYYVVLFKGGYYDRQYAVSTTALNWNDPIISTSETDPISGYFAPAEFGEWGVVPEPGTAMLLMVGAAVAALRRRKRA